VFISIEEATERLDDDYFSPVSVPINIDLDSDISVSISSIFC
jgi:hypothetical protein